MASFADYYKPPTFNKGYALGNLQTQEQRGIEDTGLGLSRLYRQYSQRTLPGIANAFAARGAFNSGSTRRAASQAGEDVGNQAGDMQRMLARQQADIARRRALIPYGFDPGAVG